MSRVIIVGAGAAAAAAAFQLSRMGIAPLVLDVGRLPDGRARAEGNLYEWRERDGSAIGAAKPAKVVMDIYVVDVRNEALISRSHFDETQSALSSNLLEADKFFKRGGKWITAHDLAQEGMEKAVKELGL